MKQERKEEIARARKSTDEFWRKHNERNAMIWRQRERITRVSIKCKIYRDIM